MKKSLKGILALALVICLFTGCTVVNVAKAGTVNGEDIPLGVYKYILRIAEIYMGEFNYDDEITMIAMYDSYGASLAYQAISEIMNEAGASKDGKSIWDKAYGEKTVGEAVKENVFTELCRLYAASDAAASKEITLTSEEKEAPIALKNNLIEMMGNKTKFTETLKTINLTENQLVDLWTKVVLSNKLSEEIKTEKEIKDEELKSYYNDNYVRVKHILVKVGDEGIESLEDAEAKANEIIKSLDEGEDFDKLMNELSSDVDGEGNVNGGDTGYIFKSGDFGNPAFEDASFALEIGEYTKEPVKVDSSYSGYHIIKRLDKTEEYFDNNVDNIKDSIKNTMALDSFKEYTNELLEEADIEKSNSKIKRTKLTVLKNPEVEAITE